MPNQLLLMRQSQPTGGSSAGNDQGLGVHLLMPNVQQKWPLAEIGAGKVRHAVFSAESFGLLAHVLHQLRTQNALGKSREILDQRCHGKLPAGLVTFDDQRFQVGSRCVQRSGVSGASGPDDDDVASFAHGLSYDCRLDGQVPVLMHTAKVGLFLVARRFGSRLRHGFCAGFDFAALVTFANSSGTIAFTPNSAR